MRARFRTHLVLLSVLSLLLLAARPFPETIDLPGGAGWEAEGIATGAGSTFYAGSIATGEIARGDLRAGTAEVWVDDPAVAPAVGLWADVSRGLLFVAGGTSGEAAVYDTRTGETVASLTLTEEDPTFVNDVVVAKDAAYFTDSFNTELYRVPLGPRGEVGDPEVVDLDGPAADFEGGAFNLNGIEATADGGTLVVVNSATGELFTVDPDTGDSAEIDLGGDTVPTGDGILLHGRTLYVLQNGTAAGVDNQVAVVKLSPDLSSGEIVDTIEHDLFETATTLARHGNRLAAVNAQFVVEDDPEHEVVIFRP